MGKKMDRLNAWEMSLIEASLRLWANDISHGAASNAGSQASHLADKFLNAKSVTITHG